MRSLSPPIRFLIGILALWVGFRLATFTPLYPEPPTGRTPPLVGPARAPASLALARGAPATIPATARPGHLGDSMRLTGRAGHRPTPQPMGAPFLTQLPSRESAAAHGVQAYRVELAPRLDPSRTGRNAAVDQNPEAGAGRSAIPQRDVVRFSRWSLSGWSLLRAGSGPAPLASGGHLGDSQAGMRLVYRLLGDARPGLAATARVSRPISDQGAEAALGLQFRPVAGLPVEILAERRIAIEEGGRDAWALGVAGGVDGVALPLGFELGGYAQAGIVGTRSRDLYAEGSLGIRHPVWSADGATLSLGAGGWAAAQPGAERVDIGPEASLRLRVADGTVRLGVSWRQRVAGDAAPGSGPAITLGTNF